MGGFDAWMADLTIALSHVLRLRAERHSGPEFLTSDQRLTVVNAIRENFEQLLRQDAARNFVQEVARRTQDVSSSGGVKSFLNRSVDVSKWTDALDHVNNFLKRMSSGHIVEKPVEPISKSELIKELRSGRA